MLWALFKNLKKKNLISVVFSGTFVFCLCTYWVFSEVKESLTGRFAHLHGAAAAALRAESERKNRCLY